MMHSRDIFWVECKGCEFSVGEAESQQEAADIWNDYATPNTDV